MPRPISTDTIIICAGLFVLIMVSMMFGSSGLVPSYGFEGKNLQSYPYEGFLEAKEYFENRENAEGFASLMSADYTGAYAQGMQGMQGNSDPAVNYGVPQKVTGFDGVQGDSAAENNGLMGFLGQNPAKTDCVSYGYTKSTGNVCLSPADIKLLTSRGGNAR